MNNQIVNTKKRQPHVTFLFLAPSRGAAEALASELRNTNDNIGIAPADDQELFLVSGTAWGVSPFCQPDDPRLNSLESLGHKHGAELMGFGGLTICLAGN